jgi:nucleoside-diphosphate-sugar epimerase
MAQQPLSTADLDHILSKTKPLWEEMRNKRIFITGGTGFFGCWLLESFSHINRQLNLNAQATVLTRDPAAFAMKCPHLAADPALAFVTGDVRSFTSPDGDFQYLIHAANETSARQAPEQPLDLLTTIIDGTARVLNFAQTHGTRKLLLTSSGAVYGKQPASLTHVPEDYLGGPDPLDPASVYAEGKRISEQMCALQSTHSPIEIKIARCFAFVGPHLPLDAHFAIGNFIGDVLAGRTIRINSDGTSRRSYLYAADLAIWLWTMLFRAPSLVRWFSARSKYSGVGTDSSSEPQCLYRYSCCQRGYSWSRRGTIRSIRRTRKKNAGPQRDHQPAGSHPPNSRMVL